MQKYLLVFCGIFFSSGAFAQTYKNQVMLGGSIGFERDKLYVSPLSDRVYTTLSVAPDVGYFLKNNFAAGLRTELSYYRAKLEDVFESYTLLLAPFVRHYVLPPSRRFNVFADASIFGSKTISKDYAQTSRNLFYGYSVMAGPVYFINSHIGLEFTLGYRSEFDERNRFETSNSIKTRIGIQVHMGR